MRTLLIIVTGFLLLAATLTIARFAAQNAAGSMTKAIFVFIGLWLAIAGANLWVGVSQAGYSVSEELPIFLAIFGLPAAVAVFIKRKFY